MAAHQFIPLSAHIEQILTTFRLWTYSWPLPERTRLTWTVLLKNRFCPRAFFNYEYVRPCRGHRSVACRLQIYSPHDPDCFDLIKIPITRTQMQKCPMPYCLSVCLFGLWVFVRRTADQWHGYVSRHVKESHTRFIVILVSNSLNISSVLNNISDWFGSQFCLLRSFEFIDLDIVRQSNQKALTNLRPFVQQNEQIELQSMTASFQFFFGLWEIMPISKAFILSSPSSRPVDYESSSSDIRKTRW